MCMVGSGDESAGADTVVAAAASPQEEVCVLIVRQRPRTSRVIATLLGIADSYYPPMGLRLLTRRSASRCSCAHLSLEAVHVRCVSHVWLLLVTGKPAVRRMKSRTAHASQSCDVPLRILI